MLNPMSVKRGGFVGRGPDVLPGARLRDGYLKLEDSIVNCVLGSKRDVPIIGECGDRKELRGLTLK